MFLGVVRERNAIHRFREEAGKVPEILPKVEHWTVFQQDKEELT